MTDHIDTMKLALGKIKAARDCHFAAIDTLLFEAEEILEKALAEQPAPVQVPVAHRDGFWCADLTCKKCYSADFRFKHKNSVVNESLTTPEQRKPLTDEQIEAIRVGEEFNQWGISETAFKYVARSIEAAHGIKENT